MSTVIIHRPSAATRAFVATIASSANGPSIAHLYELVQKPELTEAEANWVRHQVSKYVIESHPA